MVRKIHNHHCKTTDIHKYSPAVIKQSLEKDNPSEGNHGKII